MKMPESTRLFVGNIPDGVGENDLSKEFSFYGEVKKVELKNKKSADGESTGLFAFVTLDCDIQAVNKCIHEFSQEKWRGSYLNISIAKESFMERLKREREEQTGKKQNEVSKKTVVQQQPVSEVPKIITLNLAPPKRPSDNIIIEDTEHNDTFKVTESKFKNKKPPKKLHIEPVFKDAPTVAPVPPPVKQLTAADEKRLKSMQSMRTAYNEKKSLIKMALSSVDKKVNKIVFDDDGDVVHKNGNISHDRIEAKGKNVSKKSKRKHKDIVEKLFDEPTKSKVAKKSLFDDDDDDSGNEIDFKVKEQFQGEAGQKLLELQARYKSDKRFVLDERFIDRENEVERIQEDTGADDKIDNVEDDERLKQIEILQGILGTTVKTSSRIRPNQDNEYGKKAVPIKTMLRFDPTRPDHDKFVSKPAEKSDASSKKSKKERKLEKMVAMNEKKQIEEAAPEVSKDRYYKVNESLKKVMEEEKKPFSLLSLFGKRDDEDNDKHTEDAEYSTQAIGKLNDKVKNPLLESSNPFKYDSDSEDEANKHTPESNQYVPQALAPAKPLLVNENFFFTENDSRLKEGLDFFLNIKPQTENSREELKFLVKRRIRNNIRNERSHFKKVQHRHPTKTKFRKK